MTEQCDSATQHRFRGKEHFHSTIYAVAVVTVGMLIAFGVAAITHGKWTQNAFLIDAGIVTFLLGIAGMVVLLWKVIRQ